MDKPLYAENIIDGYLMYSIKFNESSIVIFQEHDDPTNITLSIFKGKKNIAADDIMIEKGAVDITGNTFHLQRFISLIYESRIIKA